MKKSVETQDLNMNKLVAHLLKQLEAKDRQMEQLNQTIANLTETINEMKRKIFGNPARDHPMSHLHHRFHTSCIRNVLIVCLSIDRKRIGSGLVLS
ncbi:MULTISPECIES: hypothetical protein [Blautia]|uniref:hypothetical protein n=1 Tax=Blautia TaxID=572511 RepID=UPI0011C7678E|nr:MULTISPECIES: hypothetical protein [Blautia]